MTLRTGAARMLDAGPRYRPLKALGEGSFGAVYRAELVGTEQQVALKSLTRVKPEALISFKREFRALSEVSHPNLVGLRELFEHEGHWFIAMDLVEGTDLLSWVRRSANDNGFDEARLRKAFADVAQGLAALHAYGLLHRDLKPSNARVTPEGKAVVLDFGLVTMADEAMQSTQRAGVGTLAYMAPEQLAADKLTAAADFYALGASLYEALTGRLPLEAESPFALMLRKANEDPVPPRRLAPQVPFELDGLCMALLDRNPKARPSAEVVLRTLLGAHEAPRSIIPVRPSESAEDATTTLEGREAELAQLEQALARTNEGELSLVFVEGESGMGKSALVAEFIRRQVLAQPETWVLSGRCYEHERVPYKAFDACMDALARRLGRLSPELCLAVLPRRAALLLELFPALGAVKGLGERPAHGAPAEPTARRLEAFSVLGELLGKLAEARPLVVAIDDLQWADEESLRLLQHLAHERPPPILLVSTVRPTRELNAPVQKALEELRSAAGARWLSLQGLQQGAIEAIARKVLGGGSSPKAIAQLSYESAGHPMLLAELCHYAKAHGVPGQRLTLDAALNARLITLSAPARRLLEALALCGRPHGEALLQKLEPSAAFGDALKELMRQRFARRDAGHEVAISHDRVRNAALAQLDDEQRVELHRRLAQALESRGGSEPSELAEHWDRAGDKARASRYYLEAATQALKALAFGNAAEHYARAFALLGEDESSERGMLLAQYGRAVAGTGRSLEAAGAFAQAAARLEGVERVRLNISAAQHQLQSAQLEDGVRNARAVLRELGVALPEGSAKSIMRMVSERALLALRGTHVEVKSEFDPAESLRLDAMTALSFPLWWADFLPGNALTIMHVRRALAHGEPSHAACALAQEAALRAIMADHASTPKLFALANVLAEQSRLPSARARVDLGEAVAAFMRGDPERALAKALAAEELLVTSCPEEPWLLTNVRMTLGMALMRNARFPELAASHTRWLAEARARSDVFAESALVLSGYGFVGPLMEDRPDEASALLERSLRPWRERATDLVLMGEATAQCEILCYAGGSAAHAWFSQKRAQHERTFLLTRGEGKTALLYYRTRALLAAYADAGAAKGKHLLGEAKATASAIAQKGIGQVLRPLLLAQVHACGGQTELAIKAARQAAEISLKRGEVSNSLTVEYLLGALEGGEAGRARREATLSFLRERGWRDPFRALASALPSARVLEGGGSAQARAPALFLGRFSLREPVPTPDRDALVEALDNRTGHSLTLRFLGSLDPAELARAKEELRVLESVRHENLAHHEGLYEHEGRLIVALEQVPTLDVLAFVRPAGQLDVERLRGALAQALAALGALHDAGTAHGDLRPSLVRVNEAGRVVILGRGAFGARPHADEEEPEDLDYLAPERLSGATKSAAADIYALGTSLYCALTGQLPFSQLTAKKVREAKLRGRPVPPWALRIEAPSDLEELCLQMLERDPRQRPSAHEAVAHLVAARTGGAAARLARRTKALASLAPPAHLATDSRPTFIGRVRELNVLQTELRRAEQGAEVLLCVQGEGGIGKTALVGEALEQLAQRTPGARVLRSRCYANEQLRLQAFDGAVDELARELNRLTPSELECVLPPRAALLAQLFPVLGSVPMIRGATKKGCPAEPSARRAAAIEAFIELLVRLSQRSLLVLVIDDLQWADAESFSLLRALLRKHPGVQLAVVAMLRPHEARSDEVRESLSQLVAHKEAVSLALEKLGDDDALVLARRLFGPKLSDAELGMAVRESAGHPLFLRELAQARVSLGSSAGLDLEQALLRRMAALGPDACTLLELLTLLARPCPAHVLERAAGLGQAFDDALRVLLRTELVQRRGPLGLACFHDRLREAVLGQIPAAHVRRLAGPLAEALEAEAEADPVECARLWDVAGEAPRACAAYGLAGDRALESLSFAAAERLYARALELRANAAEAPLVRLRSQRGHAFVALGRSAEAASQFEEAAQHASGAEAVRLRVLAAQHQIQSAQFDDGIRNARVVLKELGVPLPQGERTALARIAWERSLLSIRGTKVKVQTEIDPLARLRLDAIAGLSLPLCWSEFLPGTSLSMVYLRRALVLGESNHAARALSQEATLRAVLGEHAACSALFAQAVSLAAQSQVPGSVAFVEFGEGSAALMGNDLALALSKCLSAEDLLLTSCPEEAWLLTNVRMTICIVLMRLGDYQRLADSFKHWFAQAQERRDAFASTALFGLGLGHTTFLMEDRVAEALATLDEVMRPWKQRPSGFAQGGELFGRMSLGLYAGGSGAYRWFWEEARAEHDRSFFLRHGDMHLVLLAGRVTSALAARAEASKPERAELLARATSSARAMTAKGIGALMRPLAFAQLHALEGNVEAAMDLARQAALIGEQRGEAGHRNGAEYLLGLLEGGDGGRERRAASLTFFRARGWKEPWRALTAFVPAVRELEAK